MVGMTCLSRDWNRREAKPPKRSCPEREDAQVADTIGFSAACGRHHRLLPQRMRRIGQRWTFRAARSAHGGAVLPTVLSAAVLRSLRAARGRAGHADDACGALLPVAARSSEIPDRVLKHE
jgi:hypothetical protein